MAFSNPIVGSGDSLVREAIQSPNFVANTSGWRIGKNGSAEFNNSVIRGSLRVNGSGQAYIDIDSSGGQPFIDIRDSSGDMWTIQSQQNGGFAQLTIGRAFFAGPEMEMRNDSGIYLRPDTAFFQGVYLDWDTHFLKPTILNTPAPEIWHNLSALPYQNGWGDVSPGAGGFERGQYRLMPDGTVMLHGLLSAGTTAAATKIFTLPVGYRPLENHFFICATGNGTTFMTIQISNTGEAFVFNATAAGASVSNIRFAVAELT